VPSRKTTNPRKTEVFTIGHSNRSIEEFLELLQAFDIEVLVELRRLSEALREPELQFDTST
jgi:uncharacterized protein (DUF488 family)